MKPYTSFLYNRADIIKFTTDKGQETQRILLIITVKKIDSHLMTELNFDQAVDRKKVEREMRCLIAHQECLLYQNKERYQVY